MIGSSNSRSIPSSHAAVLSSSSNSSNNNCARKKEQLLSEREQHHAAAAVTAGLLQAAACSYYCFVLGICVDLLIGTASAQATSMQAATAVAAAVQEEEEDVKKHEEDPEQQLEQQDSRRSRLDYYYGDNLQFLTSVDRVLIEFEKRTKQKEGRQKNNNSHSRNKNSDDNKMKMYNHMMLEQQLPGVKQVADPTGVYGPLKDSLETMPEENAERQYHDSSSSRSESHHHYVSKRDLLLPFLMQNVGGRDRLPCPPRPGTSILAGSKAVDFAAFAAGVIALVININNSVNNNNNNNNNLNLNAADSSNIVANFNTNNANQVNIMPTGRGLAGYAAVAALSALQVGGQQQLFFKALKHSIINFAHFFI